MLGAVLEESCWKCWSMDLNQYQPATVRMQAALLRYLSLPRQRSRLASMSVVDRVGSFSKDWSPMSQFEEAYRSSKTMLFPASGAAGVEAGMDSCLYFEYSVAQAAAWESAATCPVLSSVEMGSFLIERHQVGDYPGSGPCRSTRWFDSGARSMPSLGVVVVGAGRCQVVDKGGRFGSVAVWARWVRLHRKSRPPMILFFVADLELGFGRCLRQALRSPAFLRYPWRLRV